MPRRFLVLLIAILVATCDLVTAQPSLNAMARGGQHGNMLLVNSDNPNPATSPQTCCNKGSPVTGHYGSALGVVAGGMTAITNYLRIGISVSRPSEKPTTLSHGVFIYSI